MTLSAKSSLILGGLFWDSHSEWRQELWTPPIHFSLNPTMETLLSTIRLPATSPPRRDRAAVSLLAGPPPPCSRQSLQGRPGSGPGCVSGGGIRPRATPVGAQVDSQPVTLLILKSSLLHYVILFVIRDEAITLELSIFHTIIIIGARVVS